MVDRLPEDAPQYWTPVPSLIERAIDMASGLVVDLCPGKFPFPWARAVRCGWGSDGTDITRDRLPFDDQSVDFLYCRHTLEDLLDPSWAMGEIARVAKSGWIETPSALAECCRLLDAGRPAWRGYMHHRSVFWVEDDTLMTCAKYPLIEHIEISDIDFAGLLSDPERWNCVYTFTNGACRWRQLRHEIDYRLPWDYPGVVARAIGINEKAP
jgi:hypothetical protein